MNSNDEWYYPRWGNGRWRVRRRSAMKKDEQQRPDCPDSEAVGPRPVVPGAAAPLDASTLPTKG